MGRAFLVRRGKFFGSVKGLKKRRATDCKTFVLFGQGTQTDKLRPAGMGIGDRRSSPVGWCELLVVQKILVVEGLPCDGGHGCPKPE